MIITMFLNIVYYILRVILTPILILDDVTASSVITTSFTTATQYIANFNQFLPIGSIISVFGAIIVVELLISAYKLIMWLIRRIPTQS